MLTKKQNELLIYINQNLRETGVAPSYEEMKDALDLLIYQVINVNVKFSYYVFLVFNCNKNSGTSLRFFSPSSSSSS